MFGILSRMRKRRAVEAALQETQHRFHTLVETAPALIFATDRSGRNSFVNQRYQTYTGLSFDQLCGEGWLSVIHPEDREAALAESNEAQSHPHSLERRLRIRKHDGEWRWFLSRTEPVAGASATSSFAWLGISIDINDQVLAEERERLLAQEVDHRAKNLLTVVQSIVQLTRADDLRAMKEAVDGRIQALARSHSLLAASRWRGVNLRALIQDELAPFGDRCHISGDDVRLNPAAAQSVGLVAHELATNAAKYGCFSDSTGKLKVDWRLVNDMLEFRWVERGGPSVKQPTRRGFGTTLIRTSVERQLSGLVSMSWDAGGLACTLHLPMDLTVASEAAADEEVTRVSRPTGDSLAGAKILLVEDEALIGMQMEELLTTAGCVVFGPAPSVSNAVDLIVSSSPDAAILDVNLAGERSYPIADILIAKKIPFAFATGYATLADLPPRFTEVRLLSKPVEQSVLISAVQELLVDHEAT